MKDSKKKTPPVNIEDVKELSATDILSVNDVVIEPVLVPEWGGKVFVRSMSGLAKEKYITSVRKVVGKGEDATEVIDVEGSSAKLAAKCLCDSKGNLLFTLAQVKQLEQKSAKALQRVVDMAAELNGLNKKAEEQAKNDLESETATDDSSTD